MSDRSLFLSFMEGIVVRQRKMYMSTLLSRHWMIRVYQNNNSSRTNSIKESLVQQRKQNLLASPLLLSHALNPLRREYKSIITSIRKLNSI